MELLTKLEAVEEFVRNLLAGGGWLSQAMPDSAKT